VVEFDAIRQQAIHGRLPGIVLAVPLVIYAQKRNRWTVLVTTPFPPFASSESVQGSTAFSGLMKWPREPELPEGPVNKPSVQFFCPKPDLLERNVVIDAARTAQRIWINYGGPMLLKKLVRQGNQTIIREKFLIVL